MILFHKIWFQKDNIPPAEKIQQGIPSGRPKIPGIIPGKSERCPDRFVCRISISPVFGEEAFGVLDIG